MTNLSAQNVDSIVVKLDTTAENTDCIYVVEQSAEFPGGEKALYDFIIKNIIYPEEAKKLGQSGKVYVQFVILENGSVAQESVKVVRGEFKLLNEEAIRVIRSMPKWIPGTQHGKLVKTSFVLPIIFKPQ